MSNKKVAEISQRAKTIDKEKRGDLLKSIPEVEMHRHLKELFQAMEPNYVVEVTHGSTEFGKDLVIVKQDKFGSDAIGVVVKCGDIKGTTLGEVDQIKGRIKTAVESGAKKIREVSSQIEQALAHPAALKSVFETIQVTKVFCVIAGGCSNQARTRLEKEVVNNAPVEVFDLDWLVDSFTEFYPQIFFEGRVIDFIQQKIENLEIKHCLSKRGKNLSEYFVDPIVAEMDSPVQIDKANLDLGADNKKMPFSQLKQAITSSKKIILIGDPGSGKSGAVAKLAIDMYKQAGALVYQGASKKKINIPILIPANDVLSLKSATDLTKEYFQPVEIKDRFKVVALILDGLDEVPSDKRPLVIEKAQALAAQLDSAVVITSRRIDLVDIPPSGFQKYELLHFQFSQAIKLFEKVVLNPTSLSSLRAGLEKIKSQIPMIPLSLMFLVELVEENKEIPASVTELYDRYYDMALGRWDRQKGISVLFEYLIKKNFLAALAFSEFLKKNRLEIPRKDFEAFFTEYAKKYNWNQGNCGMFFSEIERAGVLDIRDSVMFRHRSILDYFAAHHIYDIRAEFQNLSDFIRDLYFNDLWSEVAFFYVGLRREISEEILTKIFDVPASTPQAYWGKILAGQLLQAGWNSPSKLKQFGLQKSIGYTPKARAAFIASAKESKADVPEIFADVLLMGLSEASYGSTFLFEDTKHVISMLEKELTAENIYMLLLLLVASRRFWAPEKLVAQVGNLLTASAKLPQDVQARNLLVAMLVENENKDAKKAIKNKLMRLIKKNPKFFEKLFPSKKHQLK